MPARAPSKQAAPAETLAPLNGGYDGFTALTQAPWNRWQQATNIFSGAFGYLQRARFANIVANVGTGLPFTTLKFFALPGLSSYLIADINGKLFSYDTGASYNATQRLNPYVDPTGAGSSQLNGPWSRESLANILYEMNGQVKQAGRLANAATIEGWGLDAPDATPQVTLNSGSSVALTAIARSNSMVTASAVSIPTGSSGSGAVNIINITGCSDPTFNGTFAITITGTGPFTFTWSQIGNNTTVGSSFGNVTTQITKAVGRSYMWAWENANKSHVGAPSPATQYFLYQNQYGILQLIEPGTIAISSSSPIVTGTGTFFTSAWVGRHLWAQNGGVGDQGRIVSVQSATQLTLAGNAASIAPSANFQIFDPQATNIRLYETADGGATYFRTARNTWNPSSGNLGTNGLTFTDFANAEPPNFPFTTETAQINNVPPPVGAFVNEYQGLLLVYGITGATNSFFYSNQTATTIGLQQESFCPLNQVTLPIANASINGMAEFPGALVIWSDKQDMFRLTGLLTDNTVTGVAASNSAAQQGATIARLPYALGCASPFAAEITPLGAIWLTPNAEVWLYTDTYAPRNIGRPIQNILNSISPQYLKLARLKYYHTNTRNWVALSLPTNGASFNNQTIILDLDLLASNGSPSYFTFDMATNSPVWFPFQPGTTVSNHWAARCDSMEVVYEAGGAVRLLVGQVDLIQDIDYSAPNFGTEISVTNGKIVTHAWGNDSAFILKKPNFIRFNTNRPPSLLASDGWTFQVWGIDDDYYTFGNPLILSLTPGVNDSSTLGGNPNFVGGLAFRHSPELYKIGGVNFVKGRRLQFVVNFPSGVGVNYQLNGIQVGVSPQPPS